MNMQNSTPDSKHCASSCTGIMWWTMLLVAVLAIPSLAILISLTVPAGNELVQMGVFVFSCWISTWIGMWLMRKSKLQPFVEESPSSQNE